MRFAGIPPVHDLTYSDVFIIPGRSAVSSRMHVDLTPRSVLSMSLPLVSANMNTVTGPRLAAVLARRGGLGVLPQDMHLQELGEAIRWVKSRPVDVDIPFDFRPDQTVSDALREVPPVPGQGIVLHDERGRYLGCISASRLGTALPDARLGDLVQGSLTAISADDVTGPREMFDAMAEAELEFAPVLRHGAVVGTISRTSALRSTLYSPALDSLGRLIVGAAIGINGDVGAKAEALCDAGVDVVVVDTAHGHQDRMLDAVFAVRERNLGVPIVAGNVVTADGVRDLVSSGADIIKVGVGPGAMCTTRMMTAVGRPQFSAVLECAEAARSLGAEVWADGGVRYPRDVALALAAGASSVMIGSWFAGTVEAPGALRTDESGRLFKESYGMASAKAVRERFDRLSAYELARKTFFAEGISSSAIYLDPTRPSLDDLLDMITSGLRSSFSYAGAATLDDFQERVVVGFQSAAGYEEGKALPTGW